ncbi:hypothetical protein CkaCkLH20_11704 [Colletotrichum karsti]|uniref:Uncharacterized protein n=1 Tax=Colletotrichum karsti TaxID=1095194 RepID=A0A9P6I2M9_9PEZI|nr:uncharacterized protein CkaCkLH20_11704 [Colletotrichum karsti]KAF9870805.1 hypothetical protein CkaCkLH20_11704 [Colletotrichum karsti]
MASDTTAYVQDADDDTGSAIEGGEKTYARSIAPGSPSKTKANTPKTRKDTMRRSSLSPQHGLTDSDDTVHPTPTEKRDRQRRKERERERERQREMEREFEERERKEERRRIKEEQKALERRAERAAAPKKSAVRPPAKHVKTAPVVHTTQNPDEYRRPRFEDDASQYGIQPAQAPRPRAMSNRPNSYYGQGSRPPPTNDRWYAQHGQPQASSPFAPSPLQQMPQQSPYMPGTAYPEQTWAHPGAPYPAQGPPHPPGDYFPPPHHAAPYAPSHAPSHAPPHAPLHAAPHAGPPAQGQAHLAQRFQRPSSAMGHRSASSGSFDHDSYGKENVGRRRSVKIRDDDSRKLMPPPPRPKTSQPARQALKGPPPQRQAPAPRQITQAGYESDDFDGDDSLYEQVVQYDYDDGVMDRPRAHRRGSSAYSRDGFHIEPATNNARRNSYRAPAPGSYSEQKLADAENAALAYQNGVNGGPTTPLTLAALKAAKKSKSSRSSGSSESRDESDFRKSVTTRTTRSSAIDSEDVTIKVTGSAVLKIGGAEIQCQDGGEINITQPSRNGGSDRASTVYSDDRQSRRERPLPIRARASSQADSWGRSEVSDYDFPPQGRPPFF